MNHPTGPRNGERSSRPLLFIHVPKAAGTTLSSVLRGFYRTEEICPAYYMNELLLLPREELATYRLVAGHFEYSVTELLDQPLGMTMLRDPVQRVLSYYRFIRSSKQHPLHERFLAMDLADVLQDSQQALPVSDHQTRLFGRDIDLEARRRALTGEAAGQKPRPPVMDLDLAKERLAALDFVGLTECFHESLQLLCYTFGWALPESYASLNVTPRKASDSPDLPPELSGLIEERNEQDAELYSLATQLFDARLAAMRSAAAEARGVTEELLDGPMMAAFLAERSVRSVDELEGAGESAGVKP